MKDVESGISFLKEVRQNVVRGIRARLDALSSEQRLHVVIGMFGILVVLFLYCIWQTVTDIADRKESTNIVIEHIDSPIIVDGKQAYSQLKDIVNGTGRKKGTGAVARRGLGQLIPGGAEE
jgi:hypothetical protein